MKALKKLTALALASTMILSLAACGTSSSSSSKPDGSDPAQSQTPAQAEGLEVNTTDEITLTFSWWGGDGRHKATQEAIEAFEKKYPNIHVEPTFAAWTGYETTMGLKFTSNTQEDVMQINWNWITNYSSDGSAFYDLNKVSNIIDLTQFPENSLTDCTLTGKLQAVPVSLTGRIFFWNKKTFDAAGLEIPKTYEDLKNAGKVFKEKLGDDYYPLALGEYDRMILMVFYLESKYGKAWVEDGKVNYTEEEVIDGINFIQSMEDDHIIPSTKTIDGDGAEAISSNPKWLDGRYAGIFEWDSSASKYQPTDANGNIDTSSVELVVGNYFEDWGEYHGGFSKISLGFAISEHTKHPAEAAALIQFLLNEEEGIVPMASERGIPCSAIANKICTEKEILDNLVNEANSKVISWTSFSLDPMFEASDLKSDTGTYKKAFGYLSYGEYTVEKAAKVLLEGIAEVYGY